MDFKISFADGTTETIGFSDIDIPTMNRRKPTAIHYGPYGVSIKGNFYFGSLVVPFAFNNENMELIFFRRVCGVTDPNVGGTVIHTHLIGFGLRTTINTDSGSRNHIQLVWVYPDGTVKIGGNK